MIKPITNPNLNECLNILKISFEAGAIRFGQTEENSPHRGRTRLPLAELEKEFIECQMYGYFREDKIVGFLSLRLYRDYDTMGINDLAILPEYQNNGIGSELLSFSKEEAKRQECEKMRLGMIYDNVELRSWYEKRGFEVVEMKKYNGVDYTVGKMEYMI